MKGVSVIICTFNGAGRISKALDSIISQKISVAMELIIVDNASTDETGLFCEKYLSGGNVNFPWKVLYEKNPGLSNARMCGLNNSSFDFVLFCDDDNYLCSDYLQTGFDLLAAHHQIGVLGGKGNPVFETVPPDWFSRFSHSYAVGPQNAFSGRIQRNPAWVYGAGSFYRKKILFGIFDKGLRSILSDRNGTSLNSGGDVEWCFLVKAAGYEIWYEESLKFDHFIPSARLSWDYYLKLKKGIAGGAGKLHAYITYYSGRKYNRMSYFISYFREFFRLHALGLKYILFTSSKSPEDELGKMIIAAKAKSFRNDFFVSFSHFEKLRRLISTH